MKFSDWKTGSVLRGGMGHAVQRGLAAGVIFCRAMCILSAVALVLASTGCTTAEILTGSLVGLQGISVAKQLGDENSLLHERKKQTEQLERQTRALEHIASMIPVIQGQTEMVGHCEHCDKRMIAENSR